MSRTFLKSAAERIAATFVIAFCASLLAHPLDIASISTWHAALIAAIAAVLTVAKTIAANVRTGTASLIRGIEEHS